MSRIWTSGRQPILTFYLRLYSYFVLSTLLIILTLTPWTWRLFGLGFWGTWLGKSVGLPVAAFHVAMCACVVGIFLRTNYRVRTVKDIGRMGKAGGRGGGEQGGDWYERVGVLRF